MAVRKKTAKSGPSKSKKKVAGGDSAGLKLVQEHSVETALDPRLQSIVLKAREKGEVRNQASYTSDDGLQMVDVIARLSRPAEAVPGLKVVSVIGTGIVTGAVEALRIEEVRRHENVLALKIASAVEPELRFSVPDSRASQAQLQVGLPNGTGADGSGVIVGIVDYGCDFVHPNFLNEDGTTRLLALWDQNGNPSALSPAPYGYGREFTSAAINAALSAPDPYAALRYSVEPGEHGTHVMDIAAGNGRSTGAPGMAPKADLIFVQLAVLSDVSGQGNFGNSRRLVEAVDYIFRKAAAARKQAVVNLSLGTHGGPHDGSTLVEQAFDVMLSTQGRAIVISAGNSFERQSHATGTVPAGGSQLLRWQISQSDFTPNECEVWYPGDAELSLRLRQPDGELLGPVPLGTTSTLRNAQGAVVATLAHRRRDSGNGDNHIDLLFEPGLSGEWGVELTSVGSACEFHAWIERDDRGQSRFHPADTDTSTTLGSISCGRKTLVVASSTALTPGHELSSFSSSGPTRDGRQKPEICAPGDSIRAANSSTTGSLAMSGTSMAAPHVTGLAALLMQAGRRVLTAGEITNLVTSTAAEDPPSGTGWHARYGNGRIDALAALTRVVPGAGDATAVRRPAVVEELPTAGLLDALAAVARSGVRVRIIELLPPESAERHPSLPQLRAAISNGDSG